jgi:hypothetical protein
MKRLRDPIEAASPVMKCSLCEDAGWVCEIYRDKPWEGPHACQCGAPGAPCTSLQCTNAATRGGCRAASKPRSTRTAGGIELVHPLRRPHRVAERPKAGHAGRCRSKALLRLPRAC